MITEIQTVINWNRTSAINDGYRYITGTSEIPSALTQEH